MLIGNMLLYEEGLRVRIRSEEDPPFYLLDCLSSGPPEGERSRRGSGLWGLYVILSPGTFFPSGNGDIPLQPFDILALAPGMPPPERTGACLSVRFLPEVSPALGSEYRQLLALFGGNAPVYRFPPDIAHRLFDRLNGILAAAKKAPPLRDLIIHSQFTELLILMDSHRDKNLLSAPPPPGPTAEKVNDVAAYIRAHSAESLSLEDLAGRFYISGCYLSHRFRAVMGMTVTDYIHLTRVRQVQTLLAATDIPVTEAAMRCGFTSFSQFNRVFRRHVGTTPTRYRKQHAPPEREGTG